MNDIAMDVSRKYRDPIIKGVETKLQDLVPRRRGTGAISAPELKSVIRFR